MRGRCAHPVQLPQLWIHVAVRAVYCQVRAMYRHVQGVHRQVRAVYCQVRYTQAVYSKVPDLSSDHHVMTSCDIAGQHHGCGWR